MAIPTSAAASAGASVTASTMRPILVGKDTKMPEYVLLISTLGGIATFGLNGFLIGPVIAANVHCRLGYISCSEARRNARRV
jgi:predicted PurR-regulated permease PerM